MNSKEAPREVALSSLLENFSDQLELIEGPKDRPLIGFSEPSTAQENQMIVLFDLSPIEAALQGRSKTWILHKNWIKQLPKDRLPKDLSLIASDNPKMALALLSRAHFRSDDHHLPVGDQLIHPSSSIDSTAKIAKGVTVGPFAVIGKNCVVDEGSIIGANAVLEPGVKIGKNTHIHPQVFIGHDCELGSECEVKPQAVIGGEGFGYATDVKKMQHHRLTHFGRVLIGDRVHVGSGTTIDRGTFADSTIGSDTKIDNLCHFGHNIQIGIGTIITGGVITAGSVKIGNACVIGGGTNIAGHLEIADQVQIGGMSGITKSIPQAGAYGGYPLQPLKDYLKTTSSIASLPQLRKTVKRLENQILKDEK